MLFASRIGQPHLFLFMNERTTLLFWVKQNLVNMSGFPHSISLCLYNYIKIIIWKINLHKLH